MIDGRMTPEIAFVPYPLTSFPHRDLLVLEQIALDPGDTVCEIGVGSGATSVRLAGLCQSVVGIDVSAETIARLEPMQERRTNLRFLRANITEPRSLGGLARRFSRVVSCDTVEHVEAPQAFFAGVEALLAPGGKFLVTFPNEPLHRMHGTTRFDSIGELSAAVVRAGLHDHRIGLVRFSSRAQVIAKLLGWAPLRLARQLLGRARAKDRPQTFDDTWFFRRTAGWERVAPLVNLYWYTVLRLMAAQPPVFTVDWNPRDEAFADCQAIIVGARPE
jgi:SAM-dependent methyltransferase